MSPAPTVSVITLTWNHGAHLAECLESVRRQTFEDWEQIVLDDGSTDGALEALEGSLDPRVRVVRQPHRGADAIPWSYRRAVSLSRGRLVGFADGDDQWLPHMLERTVAALDEGSPQAALAWGDTEIFGERRGRLPGPELLERYPVSTLENEPVGVAARPLLDPRVTMPFSLLAALVRRSALERIGGLQTHAGLPVMDQPTLLRLTLEGPFLRVGSTLARYRAAGTTVSGGEYPRIALGVYRANRVFRRRFGHLLPLGEAEWRELDAAWRVHLKKWSIGGMGLRLLREGRYGAACLLAGWCLGTPWLWRHELSRLSRVPFGRGA